MYLTCFFLQKVHLKLLPFKNTAFISVHDTDKTILCKIKNIKKKRLAFVSITFKTCSASLRYNGFIRFVSQQGCMSMRQGSSWVLPWCWSLTSTQRCTAPLEGKASHHCWESCGKWEKLQVPLLPGSQNSRSWPQGWFVPLLAIAPSGER